MIGFSVDYVRSGGMRNVPVTKTVEHLYTTTAKFSGCVLLASRPAYSYPPHRAHIHLRVEGFTNHSRAVRRNYFHDKPTANHGKGTNPPRAINHRLSVANGSGGRSLRKRVGILLGLEDLTLKGREERRTTFEHVPK
ncbi:hypothetical protein AVEN_78187-1 [Araneus ventricosus]|uniref:Uncharacterized protein n=1 Tax=Araneus ventricosus TaxID=182803 RepID=A0A4Y2MQV2_ARAVE|nr:hypothetical protein AVEN_78187-1 [Araneus ventricosus]